MQAAAERNPAAAAIALLQYRQAKYAYDRQLDVHGHWASPAMRLIVLAIGIDRVGLSEKWKLLLASVLFLSAVLFPQGVLLQTSSHRPLPRAIAVLDPCHGDCGACRYGAQRLAQAERVAFLTRALEIPTQEGSRLAGPARLAVLPWPATATDHNTLAMLVRRRGESLAALLTRLDLAIDQALNEDVYTNEVNTPANHR